MAGLRSQDGFNDLLLSNPSYAMLAHKVFYTRGRPLEMVAEEILAWVR